MSHLSHHLNSWGQSAKRERGFCGHELLSIAGDVARGQSYITETVARLEKRQTGEGREKSGTSERGNAECMIEANQYMHERGAREAKGSFG